MLTNSPITDIKEMHNKYKVHEWWTYASPRQKRELLKLRMRMLTEEYSETINAYLQDDYEELIDGLIDICVIAFGTLDIAKVDVQKAWDAVHAANMGKEVGVKEGRPNPLGLPDLIKPPTWEGPNHRDNHGELDTLP